MPRNEAKKIADIVKNAVKTIVGEQDFKHFKILTCGSYRRGKEFCGDVDILITRMDRENRENLLATLIKVLEENLLVDHLGRPKMG